MPNRRCSQTGKSQTVHKIEGAQKGIDGVATLVADPPHINSTTDTVTHPISDIGNTYVNFSFGCLEEIGGFKC